MPERDTSIDLDALPSELRSPLEAVVSRQALERYERALSQLDESERAAIVGRFEMGYSYDALARAIERPSAEAARKLTERALRRCVVRCYLYATSRCMAKPMSAGLFTTVTPAAVSAAIFSAAVPLPPAMIAPA